MVIKLGINLFVDDGKVCVCVDVCGCDFVEIIVVVLGVIFDCKGVNVLDVVLLISLLILKDLKDFDYVLGLGVDWVVLFFV